MTKLSPELLTKIETFARHLEQGQLKGLVLNGVDCEPNRVNCKVTFNVGRKYVGVDVGHSGRFMVEISTGHIFGIKAYGQIHRGHHYGTLDTIQNWDWTDYYPRFNPPN